MLRGVKVVLLLINMVISLLLFSTPPVFVLVIIDALVPSLLLSAFSTSSLFSHFDSYHFGYSLIDIPLLSIARSFLIFCVYSFWNGPRLSDGPYMAVTTVCSVTSLMFVSVKGVYVFGYEGMRMRKGCYEIGMLVWSCGLAVGHVVVAYRTSCRERSKLLVYKIDIEAISALKNGYPKILWEKRVK